MDKFFVKLGFFGALLLFSQVLQYEAKEDTEAKLDLHVPCNSDYQCPGCPCIDYQCICDLEKEEEQKPVSIAPVKEEFP
ncbi:hypothetical protein GLYMA_09G026400v4 [Glycine max]|uniref:Uncharacterized protein n=1 Tax=Glycine max TaxID=3847 RepID=A0A0R0I2W2_SOYBN|nr:hypothetical protein JHK87_023784 [Glycine soja]KAH1041203.1 hypothetical protein GYH30_023835 [Glycine max]KRH36832.1 hypothetical protein GLYMA_09G026400v4 [Glycine max]